MKSARQQQITGVDALPRRIGQPRVGRGLEVERPPIEDVRAVLAALRGLEHEDEQTLTVETRGNPAHPVPVSGCA